ncbi:phosphoribosyltransferase [Metallibacterium scheffleri]|uniref:Phosphoribosyltransferase n=1 Tax=Metallibacterium scheffleri TaxID=993689 RepID=A0A4S3KQH1_9GAMM|nr:phosphoribosyltransferase [Metallibacterium scheffleri]THD11272.1 hypothetical protein B1806_03905 [Metallibacterium scheffleri]
MLLVLTSPDALLNGGVPDPVLVKVLADAKAAAHPVGLISNHAEPAWFAASFGGTGVQFLHTPGRQSGTIISTNATKFGLNPFDALVVAVKDVDVQMGKNGGAILVAAGWSTSMQVQALGIRIANPQELADVIALTSGWAGQWWYTGTTPQYSVRALSDLSGFGKAVTQADFAKRLTTTVKNGGARLNSLLTLTARSLLIDGWGTQADQVWAVYPSSSSTNNDSEVLSDFTHRLRTTVSRVRMCKRGEPLFIRHTPSVKRSRGGGGDRTDPTDQLLTVLLNPFYKTNGRLKNKHVVVVDDCMTYGVSFGVAAALLRKAGAKSVTDVALGKFGNQLRHYEIDILGDPFKRLTTKDFNLIKSVHFPGGATNAVPQAVLQALIPK